LAALSSAIEARDPYARGHSSRVTVFAQAMARGLRLDKERISVLRLGALLHDVGSFQADPAPAAGPLSDEELARRVAIRRWRPHACSPVRQRRSCRLSCTTRALGRRRIPDGPRGDDIPPSARSVYRGLVRRDDVDASVPLELDSGRGAGRICAVRRSKPTPTLVGAFASAWPTQAPGVPSGRQPPWG
jgi:hypothetical protein